MGKKDTVKPVMTSEAIYNIIDDLNRLKNTARANEEEIWPDNDDDNVQVIRFIDRWYDSWHTRHSYNKSVWKEVITEDSKQIVVKDGKGYEVLKKKDVMPAGSENYYEQRIMIPRGAVKLLRSPDKKSKVLGEMVVKPILKKKYGTLTGRVAKQQEVSEEQS